MTTNVRVKLKSVSMLLLACVTLVSFLPLSGCTSIAPWLDTGITPPPVFSNEPSGSPAPSETPDLTTESNIIGDSDALGSIIRDAEHFQQYLQFNSIRVYEENNDTFVDCVVINSYPDLLVCAVTIRFFDENNIEIAHSSFQMPDGSFMLSLQNGETPLYAQVLTDISLTDKTFELVFDPSVEVRPQH